MTAAALDVRVVTAPDEVDEVYRIRHDVFVLEQDVPLDLERDPDDEGADHFLATVVSDETGPRRTPAGAGRLVVEPGGVAHLGRLAVLAHARGGGVGVALVRAIEERAAERGLRSVVLGAQVQAVGFYERLGYTAYGEEFDDAGIAHRHMRKPIGDHPRSTMHIALIGGHGKVALHLAPILTAQGHQVTSLFRNPDHRGDVAATGAAPLVADVEQLSVEEIAERLTGHDAVVWSAGAGGGSPERTYAVDRDAAIRTMQAAEAAGVERFVMVSYFGAGPEHGVPEDNPFFAYAEAKAAADAHLQSTGLRWTILGPSGLTSDPPTGHIEAGDGVEGTSVPRADVAAVVAAVLAEPGTSGRVLDFNTGAEPIERVVARLTES